MSKSCRNTRKNKCLRSSRDTLVDWGSLLSLIEGLENLASALCRLDYAIKDVLGRFGQLRPKAFQDIARDVIRDRKEA